MYPGRFNVELTRPIERIRELREGADYEAENPSADAAAAAIGDAERFVEAVAEMLAERPKP